MISPAATAPGTLAPAKDKFRAYTTRVRHLAAEMLPHAAAVSACSSVMTLAKIFSVISPDLPFFSVLLPVVVAQYAIGYSYLYAFLIPVRALPLWGWKNVLAMVAACVAGNLIVLIPGLYPVGYPWDTELRWHIVETEASWQLDALWCGMSTGLLLVVFYVARDRESRIARASRNAEIERTLAQRGVIESRLSVMQARVEPEFLFDALAAARRLYAISPAEADKLLDDLILYLRAVLPRVRGEASTMGRELSLCMTYLDVVTVVRPKSIEVETSVSKEIANVPFPPMVLLPLTQGVVASGASRTIFVANLLHAHVHMAIRTVGGTLPVAWSVERLNTLRQTLGHFYGEAARIQAAAHDDGWIVELSVPVADGEDDASARDVT